MSVVNVAKNRDELNELVRAYFKNGNAIKRIKGKKKMPKSLRYTPETARCKGNDAPTFNPMKIANAS